MKAAHIIALLGALLLGFAAGRYPIQPLPEQSRPHSGKELVRNLLGQNLSERTFHFSEVIEAAAGKSVVPLDESTETKIALDAIHAAMLRVCAQLNAADSPVRSLQRINEASRFFEEGLLRELNKTQGFTCDFPPTREGKTQRSGYPDLVLTHTASGRSYYLDPKLVHADNFQSTLRSFYFEPKHETLKITQDACHLLIGVEHDGNQSAWTFGPWEILDLSSKTLRLKAEFHASNAELYPAKLR